MSDNIEEVIASQSNLNPSAFGAWLNSWPEERKARMKKSLADAYSRPLQKDATTSGIVTGTGLVPYSLEGPALNLWSVITPFVQKLPRKVLGGTGLHWKRIRSIDSVETFGFVAEDTSTTHGSVAGRAGFQTFIEEDDSVAWKTLGLDSFVTWAARMGGNTTVNSGQNFNVWEVAKLAALQAVRMREEKALLLSNLTQLAQPGAPTLTGHTKAAAGTGSLSVGTAYKFTVSALNGHGLRSGADGRDATPANSEGETTAAASTALTTEGSGAGSDSLTFGWTAVPGAVAYNVYGGTNAGDQRVYLGTVTVNEFTATTVTGLGGSTNIPNTANTSADANGYDGLIKLIHTKGGYVHSLGGQPFTGTKGYIAELDAAFQYQFLTYQLGTTSVYLNAADLRKAMDVILGASAPIVRINVENGQSNLTGDLRVTGVLNNYTGQRVDFVVHPYMPKGTAILWCDNFGEYYPNLNIPNPVEMGLQYDYISKDWPEMNLRNEFGVYVSGAPVLRAGFPLGILTDIA